MRIEQQTLIELYDHVPSIWRRPARVDLLKEFRALRENIQNQVDKHIQPWFVLLDEGLQFIVLFERYQYLKPLTNEAASFAVVISKIKRDLVSIRELLLIGQDSTSLVLARTFIEDLEIAMALALDPDLCRDYVHHDTNVDFWNKHIGYGRVYEKVERFLLACGADSQHAIAAVQRHKDAKKFCSDSTHGGRESALRSAFSPSMFDAEAFHHLSLGALTRITPELCLFLALECQMLAGSVMRSVTSSKPLHLFSAYKPSAELVDIIASAYVLQELILRFGNELDEKQRKFT